MAQCGSAKFRTAFTLIELVLVLAIMIAIGAIVAPSFGEAFKVQRLQSSTDRLRGVWERARLTAMKTGQTQMFTCVSGSSDYSVQPYMIGSEMVSASAGASVTTTGGMVVQQDASGAQSTIGAMSAPDPDASAAKKLDDEITFVSCMVSSDMRSMSIAQSQGGLAAVSNASQMVLFYADGSTSTAEVIIQNKEGAQRAVRMRGLTGTTQTLTPGVSPAVASATGAK